MFESQRPLSLVSKLAKVPWLVVGLVVVLAGMGVATLYSVAGGSFEPWALRHGLRCAAGLAVLVSCALVPMRFWMTAAVPVYAVALVLLAAVPVAGNEVMGAKRWLSVGGFSLQPSELMKVALVLILARFYASVAPHDVSRPYWVGVPLALMALPIALTLKQPDLGTAVLFAGLGLGLMFLAGVSLVYFATGLVGLVAGLPAVMARLHDYQRRRIEIFFDPASDPLGAGYHITQAKIALGAGGLSGQGYLKGTQNQLDFVPEKMTDFIFVMIGEEWGFWGGCVVLGVYAMLIGVLFVMAFSARTAFARLAIAGAALSISVYVVINVGMVSGLIPVVGVPLPFISYGGTALLGLMTTLGIAMSAHIHDARR